jgi:shikimate kinase
MTRIILIGFMGSGKTTLGKKLARKLELPFIDSDQAIEEQHQRSIGELFAEQGEAHFRTLEREFIEKLLSQSVSFVLSTGGGMPCFGNHMELLKQLGTTLYLKRSPKELANRLQNAKTVRPLIKDIDEDELPGFIEERLKEREGYYNQAELILDREEQDVKRLLPLLHHLHPALQRS